MLGLINVTHFLGAFCTFFVCDGDGHVQDLLYTMMELRNGALVSRCSMNGLDGI